MSNWQTLFKQEIPHLFIFLESIMQSGGAKNYRLYARPIPFKNINGLSGYYYQLDEHEAMVGLGLSRDNQSFVLYRKFHENGAWVQRYDYFNSQGIYNYFSPTLLTPIMELDLLNMDPSCPLINLLYNYLAYEYAEAESGTSRTDRVFNIEKFLQKLYYSDKIRLSVRDRSSDLAITQIFFQMNESEMDQVLNWEERRLANLHELENLATMIRTKCRVHKMFSILITIPVALKKILASIKRFFMRPWDNIKGISFYWTIGQIFNLFGFIRTNPLASFLLLTYVGFAYYYFTTPQNPYTAHIKTQIKPLLDDPAGMLEDQIQTKLAASLKTEPEIISKLQAPEYMVDEIKPQEEELKLLSENFEKGLELPTQLGRKIEMEGKLSVPLKIEAAWIETESYQWQLLEKMGQTQSINIKNYLANEYNRTLTAQFYLWDTLAHYITDNSELILDKNNEQLKSHFYYSRAITLLDDITQGLETKTRKKIIYPESERIHALAEAIRHSKQNAKSVAANLKSNSSIYKMTESDEFRLAGKKQWEILFVQNSKLDPHLKNGLEIYQTNTLNMTWAIERFYSLKSKELHLLIGSHDLEKKVKMSQLKNTLENTLHFAKTNLLVTQKELKTLTEKNLALEKSFMSSINESEILETALTNSTQMSDSQRHESKSVIRY